MKKVLIVIGVLIALVLIIPLLVESKYDVQRDVTINKPNAEVFNYIKYLKNQDNFSKWANMDPDMKKTFEGEDGTVGFVSGWESENPDLGRGEQEILKITEGERVDYELRFYEPFEATDNAFMSTESVDASSTKVVWGFNGEMPYPMNIMLLFMDMDSQLGPDLEQGLNDLKTLMEG